LVSEGISIVTRKPPQTPGHDHGPGTDAKRASLTRRDFFTSAGITGLTAAVSPASLFGEVTAQVLDGTPEQIHLTYGDDPSRTICISWASPAQAYNARVVIEDGPGRRRLVHAVQRTYTDGLNGQTVFTYHAIVDGLIPNSLMHYAVTADNDANHASPFTASFRTAPRGRVPFRWTSYGDLATPVTSWKLSSPQSHHAVGAVEQFEPLFHLLNGDLCYANQNPLAQPAVWRDFGNNVQRSAASRPWMPCPGNHEIEFGNGVQGHDSYLTRYSLPRNGTHFEGLWYCFQVGPILFISLCADDVIYQDSGAFVAGPEPLTPAPSTGHPSIQAGMSLNIRGFSGGAQTRWLEETLERAAKNESIDWIVVQMHQDAMSSSKNGNGSDKGIREAWLPLFDRHGVDLVLCGHDHDYERSWPVRGCNHNVGRDVKTGLPVDTCQPRPVITAEPANGTFDTRLGTIHLILGGGGTSAPLDAYGTDTANGRPQAKVITKPNRPVVDTASGVFAKPPADALEDAVWSARRDTDTGYGIAVFDFDPGSSGGTTSITIRYYHAIGADHVPTSDYTLFDSLVLSKSRRRSRASDP
jgi:hypothetical protein